MEASFSFTPPYKTRMNKPTFRLAGVEAAVSGGVPFGHI